MPDLDQLKVPTDFKTLSDADLADLETRAFAAGKPLAVRADADETLSDADSETLEKLSGVVAGVREERKRRLSQASSTRKAASVFATDPEPEAESETEPEAPAVVAAGRQGVAAVAAQGDGLKGPADIEPPKNVSRMIAAANLPHVANGQQFGSIAELAVAIDQVFSTMPKGPGQFVRNPVMFLKRDFPADLQLDMSKPGITNDSILSVLDHAADPNREGVALTAAAGWCAPSQIDYGLLEIETTAGMLDLPEVQINRGGIQFTTGPDFSAIFGGAGFWHQTEAQVQAATSKPCMVIPCPSFTEKRLEVEGVCITGAFLQDRGYPEMVARFTRGAMTAHAHKMNIFKINQVVSGSTLFDYTNVANLPITESEYKDLSVISRLLAFVGIQIMDLRYKYRMAEDAMLEAVMPYWVVEQVRADVQRRTGLDLEEAMTVTVDQIRRWFSVRGARVQFVYDWLDAYNTTNTSTLGQTAGVYQLPKTVEILLYPAGTFVAGVSDVVRLDTVYDSTNLALNQYTQLFTEEGILIAKRGYESRRIKATISPSGVTSATADMRTG
jgi:hypothetical protein